MNFINDLKTLAMVVSLLAMILIDVSPAFAQNYSGWSPPQKLSSAVNTETNLEGCPFISKDDSILFFASNRAGGSGMADIYASQWDYANSVWGAPFNLGTNINTAGAEVCPTYTISGRYLYFVSNRPGGCGGEDIYVSRLANKKDLTSWEPAVNLGCQFNSSANDFTPSLFEDEDGTTYLYFSSTRAGGEGGSDIYVSTQLPDGSFGTPVNVGELNTASNDQRPNIRYRDGLEIFFESDRSGTFGSSDLYSSTRPSTSAMWSEPANLGAVVNNALAQGRPSLSFDGTTLYFMQGTPGSPNTNDIWVTHRTKIRGGK